MSIIGATEILMRAIPVKEFSGVEAGETVLIAGDQLTALQTQGHNGTMQISSAGAEIDTQSSVVQRFALFGVGDPLGVEPPMETEFASFTKNPICVGTVAEMQTLTFIEDHHHGMIFAGKTSETAAADTAQQKLNQDGLCSRIANIVQIQK